MAQRQSNPLVFVCVCVYVSECRCIICLCVYVSACACIYIGVCVLMCLFKVANTFFFRYHIILIVRNYVVYTQANNHTYIDILYR